MDDLAPLRDRWHALRTRFRLVAIHPFSDGDGRTARLLMNLILLKDGHPPVAIGPEERLTDLDGIADHIGEGNPDAAGRFIRRIKETCRLIAGRPLIGRARNDLLQDLRSFSVGN